jgi:drug/metabolite transporter (DMT)-like permease
MPSITQRAYAVGVSVDSVLCGRYFFGTIMMWIYIFATRKNLKMGMRNFLLLLLVGVNVYICVFFMTSSYAYLPGAVASLLVFCYIILVNGFEMVTGREKPYPARIVCLIVAMIGLVCVVYTPGGGIGLNPKGILFAAIAGILYAVWVVAMGAKRFSAISAEVVLGCMLIVPSIVNLSKCLITSQPVFPETGAQWLYILILALSPGFLAPVAFCTAVKKIGGGMASVINTSEPVFAYIFGMIIMRDRLSWNALLGGVLIVAGILFLNISERIREKKAAS